MQRIRESVWVVPLIVMIVTAACRDFHLSMSGFDLGPSPASPGQTVVVSFVLNLVPSQRHTIRVFIDGAEHMSVTRTENPPAPVILELGDAADLIARYGVGVHVVYIETEAHDSGGATRTRSAGLELRDSSSQEEP
jgi:hypothetical protein